MTIVACSIPPVGYNLPRMTCCRAIPRYLIALLLITGPGPATVALPVVPMPTAPEEEDGSGPTELTLTLEATHQARRPTERVARRQPAVIPPHRHHAVLVRSQTAPVSFRAAANSPLRC